MTYLPSGFAPLVADGWRGWVREDCLPHARAAGLTRPDLLPLRARKRHAGRGAAHSVDLGPVPAVVRRYRHGGLLRHLTGELYRTNRARAEVAALARLRDRGAPCPEPLAALHAPGPLGSMRLVIATREIPGARAAIDRLRDLPRAAVRERRRVLAALGRAVRAFHDAGGEHPDLNARNLVVDAAGAAWVLDLDAARVHPGPAPTRVRVANLRRLARSWRKLDPGGRAATARDALAFARAYAGGRLRGLPAGAPGAPPAPAFLAGVLYDALLVALLPVLGLVLPWFVLVRGLYQESWRTQLGLAPPPRLPARPILVHGASVGEAVSATPLIRALRAEFPGVPVVLSTLSESGQAAARRQGAADRVTYFPADLPGVRGKWLDALAPRLVVALETEIWAGFYREVRARGIPLVTANGRIAPNRVARYRRFGFLYRPLMAIPDWFGMQSEADRDRVIEVGAPPGRVRVHGDLKYDQVVANAATGPGPLAEVLAGAGPRLVAGSVHPGEDGEVLDAFLRVRERFPGARLTIAPRHLERVPSVRAALDHRKLPYALRGDLAGPTSAPVVVLDTHGELARAYHGATAAFVGGSFVPVGGHSPLEPAVLGVPVAWGPQAFNFAAIGAALAADGGGREVADAAALAEEWCRLLADPAGAREMGDAGRRGVLARGGACRRIAATLRARWPML